jgi:phosphate/sulfate permease
LSVRRLYVEKRQGFDIPAQKLFADLKELFAIEGIEQVRVIRRYDIEGLTDAEYAQTKPVVFYEPPVDVIYEEELPEIANARVFAVEALPGQFDQTADSAAQCVQLVTQKERPVIRSAKVIALIGGIIGAVIISVGFMGLNGYGILKIFLSLVLSPLAAMAIGWIILHIIFAICHSMRPATVNDNCNRLQVISAALMAFAHGSNDAQKSMGIITLALLSGGYIGALEVPTFVKISCAFAMALGTSFGGWKIIRTVGGKIFRMQPVHGFSADLNSAVVIFGATLLHLPVSTTHVVSGSIMGVGAAQRVKAVHWDVARQMLVAWLMTIPCTAILSAIVYLILHLFI